MSKRTALIAWIFSSVLSVVAWGGTYEYRFDFAAGDVKLQGSESGETLVSLKDGEFCGIAPGKPWIPHRDFSVRLPAGEDLVSWSAECGEAVTLAEDVVPVPEQPPVPIGADSGEYPPVPRDAAAYASSEPYPVLRGEHLHTGSMRGIRIASFRVAPIWYVGSEKRLYLASSVTVRIETARPPRMLSASAGGTEETPPASSLFESAANSLVINPAVQTGPRMLSAVAKSGSGCQYLVITTKALATAARRLADFRADFDKVTAGVVTVEDIEANADYSGLRPDGKTDTQTKIRNCIKWYVRNKGTEYVVLAGDDTVVPKRAVHVKCVDKVYTDAPCDLYYSDLDDDWDRNKDGDYAYTTSSDGTDLYPDVIVGRIPVRNASQLAHYVDKVVAYERGTTDDSDIVRKAIWMGHTQWQDLKRTSSGWVSVESSAADSKYRSFTETFNDGLFEVKDRPVGALATDSEVWTRRLNKSWHRTYRPNVRSAFFNTSATSWDTKSLGDFKKTCGEGGSMQTVLNQGWHQLWVSCHGTPSLWNLNEGYRNIDAVTLTNRVDFVYTIACLTAAFDDSADPCLSESFLRAPSGAVAYIGCSREGWGAKMTKENYDDWVKPGDISGYSERYAVEFWRRVFDKGDKKLGPAFAAHKSAMISSCSSTGAERWVQLLLNLQGDPLLTYHLPPDKADEPDTRADGNPGLVTLLRDNLPETTSSAMTVRIAADAIPLGSSATVALEYSKSSSFSPATSVTVDSAAKKTGEYEQTLTGLSPATDYYVRGKITIDGVTHSSPFPLKLTTKAADYVSPTPVFSPASCGFSGKLTVTMTSAASDATIRYTTDGSEPTAASRAYAGPFVIDFTTGFRAAAFRDGVRIGGVAQAVYTYTADGGTPKGDLFADPIVIRGESGLLTVPSIVPYSIETGEIDHTQGKRDSSFRKSTWFEWTAPGSGEVSFYARCIAGLNYNLGSALAVYTGDTMSALTLVAESRATSMQGTNPELAFTAVEGTTYRIAALNGYNGTTPYSCVVTWEGALTSDGSYVEPDPPVSGGEPGPLTGGDEPLADYPDYRKTDGTPQSVMLSYYDGPDTRGFAWQTATGVTSGGLWLLSGSFGASADADFATNKIATASSVKHSDCYAHKAHALALAPGVHSYRVGTDGHYAYGTFTVKSAQDSFVALNVNDVQTKDVAKIDCWDRTLAAAKTVVGGASAIDTVLSGGDFIDGATSYSDYVEWGVAADRARAVFPDVVWTMASGNHDYRYYDDLIDEDFKHQASDNWGCHSYDVGNVHVASLPYYSGWNTAVGAWLEADLAASTSKWRVVSMHFGPYTTVDNGYGASESYVKAVAGICAKYRVDLVLQAHDHGYSKTLPYLWDGPGYATSDADRATTVNVSPAVESFGGESWYKDPRGTVYVSAGCAGHRVGENKGYATSTYKNRGTKIFVDTVKVGSKAGADATLVPETQMFGVLRIEGDRLAYDWYLVDANGAASLFDSLRVLKTEEEQGGDDDDGDDDDEEDPPGPGPGPGPGTEGGDYFVSPAGSDSNAGTSREAPLRTIAAAVAKAESGQTVRVLAGTYDIDVQISVAKAVAIVGEGWSETVIRQTTTATNENTRCITLDGGARLEGVTLTGGRCKRDGGGAWVKDGTISWCCISNNVMKGDNYSGGGVSFASGRGRIDHCLVTGNVVCGTGNNPSCGAGIGAGNNGQSGSSTAGDVEIDTCLVCGNRNLYGPAGGIGFKYSETTVTVRNTTVVGNSGSIPEGGGVYFLGCGTGAKLVLINDVIADNQASGGEQNLLCEEGFLDLGGSAASIVRGSSQTKVYEQKTVLRDASVVSALAAKGFSSASPAFANAAKGNYRLTAGSPAVGVGVGRSDGGRDLDGKPFVANPSLGCYEFATVAVDEWDVPGTKGGIRGKDDGKGGKCVTIRSVGIVDGRLTVEFEAARVDADGETFVLYCKEDLADAEPFEMEVRLTNGAEDTLGVLEGLTDRPRLFVIGIGRK